MRYRLAENVTLEQVDDNSVLVSENGDAAILNETGTKIVELICQDYDSDKIVCEMVSEYGVAQETAYDDLTVFINEMISKEMLEI